MRIRTPWRQRWLAALGLAVAACSNSADEREAPLGGAGGTPESSGMPSGSVGTSSPPVAGTDPGVEGPPGPTGDLATAASTEDGQGGVLGAPVPPPTTGATDPAPVSLGGQSGNAGTAGTRAHGGSPGGSGALGGGGSGRAGSIGVVTPDGSGGVAGMGDGGEGGFAGASTHLEERSISFGTLLNPHAVVAAARARAAALADPSSPDWQAKGDQRRTYHFEESGTDEPYRIVVPESWDGSSPLPLVMFLHGAGSDESTYLNQNGGQLVTLAEQHGYLLVSPKGAQGAYGNFLRLTGPFGDEAGAAELMAQVTPESDRTNELSEQDVINVLELVLVEYPIDRGAMFIAGHSMGSGGTWYIGGKYADYWSGLAPMSGPFVQESGYPWEDVRELPILVTEGTQTPSLDASLLLAGWLDENGFLSEYLEVGADHGGMIALVLPDVFEFFDRSR